MQTARSSAFASQLRAHIAYQNAPCSSCSRQDLIYDFAYDQLSDSVAWGLGRDVHGYAGFAHAANVPWRRPSHTDVNNFAIFHSEISSVSISNDRLAVFTALNASDRNVFIAALADPSHPDFRAEGLDETLFTPTYLRLGIEETLWASSPNPPGGQNWTVIGASGHAFMLEPTGRTVNTYPSSSDVRAVDWLNPNTAVLGMLRRTLLWDSRTAGTSMRFKHSEAVSAVRRLNDKQVVVGGPLSTCIYDVRMPVQRPYSQYNKQVRRNNHVENSTQPVLRIDAPTKNPRTTLDVWPDAHILARRDDANVIQLYSLTDGRSIGALGKPDHSRDKAWIRRLRFVEDNKGSTSLMSCKGAEIEKWTYGGLQNDEGEPRPVWRS